MRRGKRVITPIKDTAGCMKGHILDIMGIIVEFSFHRISKGSDFVCVLKVVDRTQQMPEFTVMVFTSRLEHLPVIKSHGDVIVLHDVKIDRYEGEVNAVFRKGKSSFGLFGGNNSDDFSCYQALNNFSLAYAELNHLTNLRNWWKSAPIHIGSNEYLLSIGDLSENTYFDLVCKVLHISYDDERGVWILFVWDGTDAPLLSLNSKIKDDLPLQFESVPSEQSVIYDSKHVGTILRVMTDELHENLDRQFLGVGKWVRIRSMVAKVLSGMWYATLNTSSRVRLLPDDDNIVVDCKRKYRERIFNHGRMPLWRNYFRDLTAIVYDGMESVQFHTLFHTLRDILGYKEDDYIFFCVVRVLAIKRFPALNDHGFALRLTLEDPTARINSFLCKDEDLAIFLNGFSEDLSMAKMKEILGVPQNQTMNDDDDCTRFPPLVKCCIGRCRDASGNITYEIINTKLT